jgi:multiple sugar transport system ATP-binding protein
MGDRLVVMKDGLIQQIGSPLELYNTPANRFVAGFIGSPAMNFFGARFDRTGNTISLQTDSFHLTLPHKMADSIKDYRQDRVIVGIRPEDLHVAADHASGKTFPTIIEVVEPIGSETHVNVDADGIPLIAAIGRRSQAKPHEKFVLEPNMEQLQLFDASTEKSLFHK